MEKTKEEIIVGIFGQFTSTGKGDFMKMLGAAANAKHNVRTSMENEQTTEVFASQQELEGQVYITLEQKRGKSVSGLYGNGIVMTERVPDYLWGRQTVTPNNIINVDTPEFKAQHVTFEEEFTHRIQNAARRPNPRNGIVHTVGQTGVGMNTIWAKSSRLDGNSVDMDQEQVELARIVYEYQYMLSSINSDINRLKSTAEIF